MSLPRQQQQTNGPSLSRRDLLLGRRQALPAETVARGQTVAPEQVVARVGAACFMAQGITCRLCEDSCDTAAFRFRPQLGGKAAVSVEEADCTGCAACIELCPADAITLTAATNQSSESETAHGR